MGITKTDLYTAEQNQLAVFAKAFAHPARIAILQHLFEINQCVCGDLVNEIGLAQSTISQHLKELKNLEVIRGNVEGTRICYCIEPEKWQKIKQVMTSFLSQEVPHIDC